MGTRYHYCASCAALWSADAPETCPVCLQPLLTGSSQAAFCPGCAVAWHPGVSAACWVCGRTGVLAPGLREWESDPGCSVSVAVSRFSVGSRRLERREGSGSDRLSAA